MTKHNYTNARDNKTIIVQYVEDNEQPYRSSRKQIEPP